MGNVYFCSGNTENRVKIGQTGGPVGDRLRNLRTGDPDLVAFDQIETDDPSACETHVHALLEPQRVPGTKDWFDLTPAQAADAARLAREWCQDDLVMQTEADHLAKTRSDSRILDPDALARELYNELRRLKAEEYAVSVRRLRVENELRVLVGTADGIDGLVRWRTRTRRVFSPALFRASEYGALWDQFKAPVTDRPFKPL